MNPHALACGLGVDFTPSRKQFFARAGDGCTLRICRVSGADPELGGVLAALMACLQRAKFPIH